MEFVLVLSPTLLLAGSLLGCQGLAGTWTGDLLCLGRSEIYDGTATLALVSDRGGEFDGELRVEGGYQTATLRGEMVLSWELELEKTRLSGAQDLDQVFQDCAIYVDGYLQIDTCPEDEAMQWAWDGHDQLTMQGTTCELVVERSGLVD